MTEPRDARYTALKAMLGERKQELQAGITGKMGSEGTPQSRLGGVIDRVESAEADIQEDIELAIIQMKADTREKIAAALAQLEAGNYGNCFDCGAEISEKRLRALPFAVRCKDCEEAKEVAEQRARQLAQQRRGSSIFFNI